MANRYAVKAGSWSDATVWNGGTLPTAADDVFANAFTVNIDQDITVMSIRRVSASGIAAGGAFTVTSVPAGTTRTITLTSGMIGTTHTADATLTLLTISSNTGTVLITANLTAGTTGRLIDITGTCTVNIAGSVTNAGSGNNTQCIRVLAAATMSMGDVTGNTSYADRCAVLVAAGAAVATGNVTGSSAILLTVAGATLHVQGRVTQGLAYTGAAGYAAIIISGSASIEVDGDVVANSVGRGISTSAALTLAVHGAVTGEAYAAIYCTAGLLAITIDGAVSATSAAAVQITACTAGSVVTATGGVASGPVASAITVPLNTNCAVNVGGALVTGSAGAPPTNAQTWTFVAGGGLSWTSKDAGGNDVILHIGVVNVPAESDVREGVHYGGGLIGTLDPGTAEVGLDAIAAVIGTQIAAAMNV